MTHLVGLGLQVAAVVVVGPGADRDALDDGKPVSLYPGSLGRVVGEEPHRRDPEVGKDLRPYPVVAGIGRKTQFEIRLDGVPPVVLEVVGGQLVEEPDPPALVTPDVDNDPLTGLTDGLHGRLELKTAIATEAGEHVAGEALGVSPHQNPVLPGDIAHHQSEVLPAVEGPVPNRPELTVRGGELPLGHPLHESLVTPAVGDEVGDGSDEDVVLFGEEFDITQPRHGPIVIDHLSQHRCRVTARHGRQVHRSLGVPGAP